MILAEDEELRCLGLLVMSVDRTVKFLLDQLETNLYSAANVSEAEATEEITEEMTEDEEVILMKRGCMMQFAIDVERNVKFRSDHLETNLYSAANVSKKKVNKKEDEQTMRQILRL